MHFVTDFFSLTADDIQKLITYSVSEDRYIEYKQQLPDSSDSEVKEFLADVSSFANAAGGTIIYGISEEDGLPVSINGIESDDFDNEKLRLEEIIRNGVKPKINQLFVRDLEIDRKKIILIQIPNSWSKPHVVDYKRRWRFYVRTSAGKHPMDIEEVKTSMLQTNNLSRRMDEFRLQRLNNIEAGISPARLDSHSLVYLHLIPFSALYNMETPELEFNIIPDNWNEIKPLSTTVVSSSRYTLEGFLNLGFTQNEISYSGFVQVFRNGIFESVDSRLLKTYANNDKALGSINFEREIVQSTKLYLDFQKRLGVLPPIALLITLVNVEGYYLAVDRKYHRFEEKKFPLNGSVLKLPELIIEDYPQNVPNALKPLFDSLWNAFGWDRSRNYDKDGNWQLT